MGKPDWSRITTSGKPFEEEKKSKQVEEELELLKKENVQLRELLEEYIKPKKTNKKIK